MSTAAGDVRYALRSLRANPGFAAIAIVSLALGIGVNTAIFSLVDQLLLWSVPARDPAQLVNIEGGRSSTYAFYHEYRDRNQVFSGLFASSHPRITGVRPEGAASVELAQVSYVSGNYFETLGVGAAAGRTIANADDARPGGSPVAMLSYAYWQRRFAGASDVIGHKLAVNGFPLVIAGIAEKGFDGVFNGAPADVFIPITMYPAITPSAARVWYTPNMYWLTSMARLKPGESIQKAQAAMRVLWPQAIDAVNDAMAKAGGRRRKYDRDQPIVITPAAHGESRGATKTMDPLQAMLLATGLVLLIACANVANLLLARATGRRKEIAVRLAVGATRGRLIRQLLGESLVLAVIGGAAGIAVAYWGVLAAAAAHLVDANLRFRPSLPVAAFSIGVTLLTGVLFGLAPAFRGTSIGLSEAMKDGGPSGQAGSRFRLGKIFIAVQVALSVTLLVGAGLFIRTLRNLDRVDLGFQPEHVVIADIDPTNLGYHGQRLRTFYDDLLERARHIRGVRSAGLSLMTPMGEFAFSSSFSAEGYQPKPDEYVYANPVSSGFFTTLGIPVLLGRDFTDQDQPAVTPADNFLAAIGRMGGGFNESIASASKVCIINESLARRIFGDGNPIGRHISFEDRYSAGAGLEIVGVVKDVHYAAVRHADSAGVVYTPTWARGAEARWLGVRVAGDTAPVIAAIRGAVRQMDPNVPVLKTRTMQEYVNATVQRERMIAYLSGFFGILALAMASVGLYGVMAYAVTQRTREVGIRMALGAQRGNVVRMIVRESLVPVLFGMGFGMFAALGLTKLVAGMLFGVAPRDPASILAAAVVMLGVALLASAIPARRASRIEPLDALRYE